MPIRPYHADDLDAIVRLSLRAWEPVFASIKQSLAPDVFRELHPDWRVGQRKAVVDVCADKESHVWVADVDATPVGFVAIGTHSGQLGEIQMLAVDPAFQRRGIGTALNEFALNRLQEAGVSVAMVETGGDPGHAPARTTYEKCGFQLLPIARYFKKLTSDAQSAAVEIKAKPEMSAQSVVEILTLAQSISVEVWLDGGWGIDALLGDQTRPHSDLDIILRSSDSPRIEAALKSSGFHRRPGGSATNSVLIDPAGREVDLHAINFDERGYGIFELPDGRTWPFPPSTFRGQGTIEDRPVRCLSAEAQVQCHGQGYVPTEKDLDDMERLQARFEVVLPLHLSRQNSRRSIDGHS